MFHAFSINIRNYSPMVCNIWVEYYLTEVLNNFDIKQKIAWNICFTISPSICFSSVVVNVSIAANIFSLFHFFLLSSFFYSEIVQIISKSIEFELFDMKFITFKIDVRDQMIQINDTAIIDVNGDIISTWYTWGKKLEIISLLWCDPV